MHRILYIANILIYVAYLVSFILVLERRLPCNASYKQNEEDSFVYAHAAVVWYLLHCRCLQELYSYIGGVLRLHRCCISD